jgi:hypothetical protein
MANVLIGTVLEILREELNTFLGKKEPRYLTHPPVQVSDLVDQKGEWAFSQGGDEDVSQDRVIITLVNIEEETFGKAQLPFVKKPDHTLDRLNPAIKLNVFTLFSAFSNMEAGERYRNCLNIVSLVVLFFQSKHVFDHQNTPNLPADIEEVVVELVSPTFEQQNFLWGMIGAKYMPSVLYKLRLLEMQETEEVGSGPVIAQIKVREDMIT